MNGTWRNVSFNLLYCSRPLDNTSCQSHEVAAAAANDDKDDGVVNGQPANITKHCLRCCCPSTINRVTSWTCALYSKRQLYRIQQQLECHRHCITTCLRVDCHHHHHICNNTIRHKRACCVDELPVQLALPNPPGDTVDDSIHYTIPMQKDGNGREDDDPCHSSSLVIMCLSVTDQQLTQEWHVDERRYNLHF